jgi:undecaprenyl diphosphate synthase
MSRMFTRHGGATAASRIDAKPEAVVGYNISSTMKEFLDWARSGSEEAQLASQLDPARIPRHVAVIMDGNGRWAKRRCLPRVAGHRAGVRSVREIIEACCRLDIGALTLYAFSVENWKRPRTEVETLWGLLRHYLHQELPDLKKNNVRFQVIGRIEALPREVQNDLDFAMVETAGCSGLQLNIALNYGGRSELVDAVNAILARARQTGEPQQVDEATISAHLYTAHLPDPDLLIRTSGEIRVSNFLLWQIAYAEIWVTEKLWPDFRTRDLLEALLGYQKRERRYGGLGEAVPETETDSDVSLVGASPSKNALDGETKSPRTSPLNYTE